MRFGGSGLKKRRAVLAAVLAAILCLWTGSAEAASTEERLTQIEQQLLEIRLIRENLAEQIAALGRLQDEVAQLRGALEELRHQLQTGSAPGPASADLEPRLARLERALGLQPWSGPAAASETGQPPAGSSTPLPSQPPAQAGAQPGTQASAGAPAAPSAPAVLTEDEAFEQAKQLYKQGRMEEAREAFRKFSEDFPASNKVPAAKFWTGETFYYQKRFEEAILEYQKVIQEHAQAEKVPSALLKQAFAFAEIKDTTSARLILQRLIKMYPKTQQAVIAKKKLATLRN